MNVFKRFLYDSRAASAVEFAVVALVFVSLLLFLLVCGTIIYLNQVLDFATAKAARQIMIGAVQKAAYSQADFRTKVVCPLLPSSINCDDVIVNLYTLTKAAQPNDYYQFTAGSNASALSIPDLSNATAAYKVGLQGSYQYLLVMYPVTFLPGPITQVLSGTTYKGAPAFLTVSTAAFMNEQF